jgi:hypothetical protein
MAMTPAYALAHGFLPNMLKLKGAQVVVGAVERRDLVFFDALWRQAHVAHHPYVWSDARAPYRAAAITLPRPAEMGEAHMAGIVVKTNDPVYVRYFTLDHDFVLARQADRTVLAEREGQRHTKHGEDPAVTGNPEIDAKAFVDCFMELIVPTKVTRK